MTRAAMQDAVPLPEAARLIGRSWHATWALLLRGELTGEKVGGHWLVERSSLDRYLAHAAREPAAAAK